MKIRILIALPILLVILLSSCKKYPEGPMLSFRSRAARVANEWKMEKVLQNGSDVTSLYTGINYVETYDKDGNYSYSSTMGSGSGKWDFQSKDTQLKRSGVSGQPSITMTILRLKQRSFWYSFMDGNVHYEFHLIPNN